jgi:hypothetical protein
MLQSAQKAVRHAAQGGCLSMLRERRQPRAFASLRRPRRCSPAPPLAMRLLPDGEGTRAAAALPPLSRDAAALASPAAATRSGAADAAPAMRPECDAYALSVAAFAAYAASFALRLVSMNFFQMFVAATFMSSSR